MRRPTSFVLRQAHLSLMREATIDWNEMEAGAPTIDPKRPYGNGDVARDVAHILGWPTAPLDPDLPDYNEDFARVITKEAMKIHQEMQWALEVVLQTQAFVLGTYERPEYGGIWQRRGKTT